MPEFPTPTVKQPLFQKSVTREFEVKDGQFAFKKDHPVNYVDGMICITPEEYTQIRNWIVSVQTDYTCKLKKSVDGKKE